jgi:CO/xanthine dehydrogenase Mo-binding subunit
MRDFAEVFLEMNRRMKDLHNAVMNSDHTTGYLISCDVTDLAQELETVLHKDANE